jgi:hypothetical protein
MEMTREQETLIRQLRMKGTGYKAIATQVGLSRDIVRNFCRSNQMGGFGEATKLNLKEQMGDGKACVYCGKEIKQPSTGRPKRFCSDKCRRQWWKANPHLIRRKDTALYHGICERCGKKFVSYGNQSRKYCSHNCYIKVRFWEGIEDGV